MRKKELFKNAFCRITVVIMLLASLSMSTYAATEIKPETGDATVRIVSNLMMPKYVTIPDLKFDFKYTKKGISTGSEFKADSSQPNLINLDKSGGEIAYSKGITLSQNVNDYSTYILKTDNIIPAASSFSHAGEYIYIISQTASVNSTWDKFITYSKAEYEMHVFVENTANGLRVGEVYVKITKNTDGTAADKSKVDIDEQEVLTYRTHDFSFTNYLVPTEEKLTITNSVNGTYADLSKSFTMTALINNPTYMDLDETRKYYGLVVNAETLKPTSVDKIAFTSDLEKKFYLKNGEMLVFVPENYEPSLDVAVTDEVRNCMPAGIGYEASFGAAAGYQPQGQVTHGGVVENAITGTMGEKLTLSQSAYVDLGDNKSDFIATYREPVLTGVNDNVLPFVFLTILAIIGISYINRTNKSRRNEG